MFKKITSFHKSKQTKDGLKSTCGECRYKYEYRKYKDKDPESYRLKQNKICKAYRKRFPLKRKDTQLKSYYGISLQEYNDQLAHQDGRCCICKKQEKLVVDHCHSTGKVRGLLCLKCNLGIGYLLDNVSNLEAAIDYIKSEGMWLLKK